MNYTKATLILLSGIVSIAVSLWLSIESKFYGFLAGYGYTALAGGVLGILYIYLKQQRAKKGELIE